MIALGDLNTFESNSYKGSLVSPQDKFYLVVMRQ